MLRSSSVLLALLCIAPALAAQEPAPDGPRPDAFCFRPRPADRCRAFLVTELSRSSREFGTGVGVEDRFQWDWGAMVNVGGGHAVGATLVTGEPKHGHRGLGLRYRRWLGSGLALDVAPGVAVVGDDFKGRRLRLTAHTALSLGDFGGVFAHGESSRDGGRMAGGGKLVSWPGLVAGAALFGFLAILPET